MTDNHKTFLKGNSLLTNKFQDKNQAASKIKCAIRSSRQADASSKIQVDEFNHPTHCRCNRTPPEKKPRYKLWVNYRSSILSK